MQMSWPATRWIPVDQLTGAKRPIANRRTPSYKPFAPARWMPNCLHTIGNRLDNQPLGDRLTPVGGIPPVCRQVVRIPAEPIQDPGRARSLSEFGLTLTPANAARVQSSSPPSALRSAELWKEQIQAFHPAPVRPAPRTVPSTTGAPPIEANFTPTAPANFTATGDEASPANSSPPTRPRSI